MARQKWLHKEITLTDMTPEEIETNQTITKALVSLDQINRAVVDIQHKVSIFQNESSNIQNILLGLMK